MRYLTIATFCCILFISCKDDDANNSQEPVIPNDLLQVEFLPFAVGNYWVYEVYKVDALGNETLLDFQDTIRITGEAARDGEIYYTFLDNNFDFGERVYSVRDSSGFLVDIEGTILFSDSVFDEVLRTDIINPIQIVYTMDGEEVEVSAPAGDFDCLNFTGMYNEIDPDSDYPIRILNNFYSAEIGLVSSNTFFFSDTENSFERRLLEFNIEE